MVPLLGVNISSWFFVLEALEDQTLKVVNGDIFDCENETFFPISLVLKTKRQHFPRLLQELVCHDHVTTYVHVSQSMSMRFLGFPEL